MEKVDLSSYRNEWYKPEIGASRLKQVAWYYINILFFTSYWLPVSGIKRILLQAFGATLGKGVVIKPGVNIKYPWKLKAGDHCWLGEGVWIDNLADVQLGNSVCLSQGAFILTGNHHHGKVGFDLIVKPVTLEDGVWIGAKAIVCPGVTARSHAVLTVQSVAATDLESYSIYKGNPAVFYKTRNIQP